MKFRNILLILFILGIIGGAGWLFYNQQHLPDVTLVEQRSAQMLLRLQEDNAQVNEAMLRARDNIDTNYDNLTRLSAVLRRSASAAREFSLGSDNQQTIAAAKQTQAAIASKLEYVERFKSHNSVLKNSLRYAPQVGANLARIASEHSLIPLALAYLNTANNLQLYSLTQEPQRREQILQSLSDIRQLESAMPSSSVSGQIEFLNHARTVLTETSEVNTLVSSVLQPLEKPFTALQEGLDEWQNRVRKVVAVHNQYIIIYTVYLAIGLLFILWWLISLYRTLDRRIAERTAELKQTYDDLTRSQMMLMQSEKMATLGQMVAGVAHEVNTPLGYVKGNVDLLQDLFDQYDGLIQPALELNVLQREKHGSREEKVTLLKTLLSEAQQIDSDGLSDETQQLFKDTKFGLGQINELIVNLRNFARLDEERVKRVRISDCINSSLNIARNNVKRFQIEKRYEGKELPEIECSPSQINQVLLNLFNNAAQATPNSDARLVIDVDADAQGDFVTIRIADNGMGMTSEVQKKIFEPFFTTKGSGEGTGLGLAICKQIIEAHGGNISVRSQLNKGSIFSIHLPISDRSDRQDNGADDDGITN